MVIEIPTLETACAAITACVDRLLAEKVPYWKGRSEACEVQLAQWRSLGRPQGNAFEKLTAHLDAQLDHAWRPREEAYGRWRADERSRSHHGERSARAEVARRRESSPSRQAARRRQVNVEEISRQLRAAEADVIAILRAALLREVFSLGEACCCHHWRTAVAKLVHTFEFGVREQLKCSPQRARHIADSFMASVCITPWRDGTRH
jgi:hypothetical protein